MVKKPQKPDTDKKKGKAQSASTVKNSAQQIWLAGLGAFSKAQQEGGKVFEALVKEGLTIQADAEKKLSDIWLAGLGALSKAQQEGGKVFEALVKEGQTIQADAEKKLSDASHSISSMASGISATVQDRLEELTMSQLRSQIKQHLLMVEEVLGGMDTFIQRLEKRVSRIEEGLGFEPEGLSASGWIADLQRAKTELSAIRNLVK